MGTASSTVDAPKQRQRVLGLDMARGIAILGIFLNHYGGQATIGQKGWATSVVSFTSGRALPIFVLLSGAGFTFLMRRSTKPVREMAGRAVFLLLAGLAFDSTMAIGVILQFYALYFMVGLLFRRLPDRWLLWSAAAVAAIGAVTTLYLNKHLPQTLSYSFPSPTHTWGTLRLLAHPWDLFVNLVFNGGYPLLPVFAFFLVGMWLGRKNLGDLHLRRRIGAVGLAMTIAATGAGWATQSHRPSRSPGALEAQLGALIASGLSVQEAAAKLGLNASGGPGGPGGPGAQPPGDAPAGQAPGGGAFAGAPPGGAPSGPPPGGAPTGQPPGSPGQGPGAGPAAADPTGWTWLDQTGHSNMPVWMIAATGFALAIVAACLMLADRFRRITMPIVFAGQLALTLYLGHIALLRWPLKRWPYHLGAGGVVAAIFGGFIAAMLLSTAWRRWFAQGPLESLLRLAGKAAAGQRFTRQ
jgi:uncharacterized membrane protein YeiB